MSGWNPGRSRCAPGGRREWGAAAVAAVIVTAGLLSGCSKGGDGRPPVYPVTGQVKVAGEIPEGALVVFYPAGQAADDAPRPSAKVGSDGAFRLTTYEADDGAPAGEYVATLEWNKLVKKGADYVAGPNAVPPAYASRDTSPWKVTVSAVPNELPPLEITK